MEYIDLNILNESLSKDCRELGWKEAKKTISFFVKSTREINELNGFEGKLFSIESENPELLVNACNNKAVKLVNPFSSKGFSRNHALIRAVSENKKCFEIPLNTLLKSSFVLRAKEIYQIKEFLRNCLKLGAEYVFTSRAASRFDLKKPSEVIAIGTILGLSKEQAEYAISVRPKMLLEEFK